MKHILAVVAFLLALGSQSFAANCTNPVIVKDGAGTSMNFNTTVDGSNNCTSNVMPGAVLTTLSGWTSATGALATQTLMSANSGAPAILVQLNQTSTISAGAATFEGTYDGTNWVTVSVPQILNPNTLAPIPIPYSFVASTQQPFLILTQGYQGVRVKLSTQITGSGTVTPFVALLSTNPVIGALLNPLASNSPTTVIGGVAVSQTTPGTSNGMSIVGVNAATALAGNGVTGTGSPRVTIASDNTPFATKIDQTTPGTTNGVALVGVNGATALAGNGATGTGSPRVTIADNNSPLAVTQSGTWNVTNLSGTVSLPTGASTAAKQPALGTAGSASTDVISVQGEVGMTPIVTNPQAATTGGCTPAKTLSAASTNSTSIKGSAGTLCKFVVINTTATLYYLKTYNTSSAPTCNSDTVVATYPIPPSNGGVAVPIGPFGEAYTTGIGFCLTAGIADNDNASAATGVALSYSFK